MLCAGLLAGVLAACSSASPGAEAPAVGVTALDVTAAAAPVSAVESVSPGWDGMDDGTAFATEGFTGTDIWVDPVHGDDHASGADRASALRTVSAAWEQIPAGQPLTTGVRIMLVAGTYPVDGSVNYWEDRHGSAAAPIVILAADGPHTAVFSADINMFGVSHFSLIGVDIVREGDTFHCEQCDHILIHGAELSGGSGAHETVKINQSQYIAIEQNDIHGADDNNIDFVAVQHARVVGNRIHDAQDWCEYAKGGSASVLIRGNEIFDCGTGGVAAGQGTGFEFMVAPWLNYEAYGVEIIGNTIHDTDGAGLGVAGGYNIVLARNTLYRVGARSHTVEFTLGRRGCDGTADRCAAHHDAGGWGSTESEQQIIPNRHVWFIDNLVINPTGAPSQWQQFQIDGPTDPPGASGVPSPAVADDDLHIIGNVVWNGAADLPLGTGDGCPPTNAGCNEALIRSQNAINTIEPQLVDPEHGDYRLSADSAAALPVAVAGPRLMWSPEDTPIQVPAGDPQIVVAAGGPPGAPG